MLKSTEKAFSLIEAAVAIAIMAILAGAAVPLVVKGLNQQREQKTRENLKSCFEALFGSRERRLANMRADFGFSPGALVDLRSMTLRASAGNLPPYALDTGIYWGWNGPYWQGSLDSSSRPLDAWGRPVQLDAPSWQLRSAGQDGVMNTTDDILYPQIPIPPAAQWATLSVSVNKISGGNYTGNCTIRYPQGTNTLLTTTPVNITNLAGLQSMGSILVNPGPVSIDINPSGGGTFARILYPLDLLPGEARQIELSI